MSSCFRFNCIPHIKRWLRISAILGPIVAALFISGCVGEPTPIVIDGKETPLCAENGYCVVPEFAEFYRQYADLLGPPISGPLQKRDRLVQYFPAGRLEYVPENPAGWRVGLAYLAEETCGRQPPLAYSDIPEYLDASGHYFPQTGHSVRDDFWRFVQSHGGIAFFGEPISEARLMDTETVQDFIRVQLRRSAGGQFYLAELGRLVLEGSEPSAGLCPSVPADNPDAQSCQTDGCQDNRQ